MVERGEISTVVLIVSKHACTKDEDDEMEEEEEEKEEAYL